MTSRLALITFLDVDTGNVPAHPIVIPPGQLPVYPDQGLPGQPPGIWPSPGHPAHPIAPGGPPVGIWPSPGHPAHPIAPGGSPGRPSHPIFWPPYPDNSLPPYPAHPIAPGGPGTSPQPPTPGYPVQLPSFTPEDGGWVWSFIPGYGWGWSWIPNPNPARPDNSLPGPQPGIDNTLPTPPTEPPAVP